jgi:hypothetical protein
MSAHRSTTRLNRFTTASKRAARKAGHGIVVAAGVSLEVLERAALRADADAKEEAAKEARLQVWGGKHEKGFLGGIADVLVKQDDADKAKARYEERIAR